MLSKYFKILFNIKRPKRGLISFVGFFLLAALILSFAVSYRLAHSHKRLIYIVEKVKSELTFDHLQQSDKLYADYVGDNTSLANSKKDLNHILKSKSWDDVFIPVINAKQIVEIESILKKITVFDSLVHQKLTPHLENAHNILFVSLIKDINTLQDEMNVTYKFQDNVSQAIYVIILILFLAYIMAVIYVINRHTKIRDVLIAKQNRLEDTVKSIEKNINIKIGADYYISLAKELNKQFKADYIIIASYNNIENTSTTLAYINKQKVLSNITYDLPNTPCAIVLKEGYAFYGSALTTIFDKDAYLKKFNIESYVGIAVYNEAHQVVGHLVAMYCKPILEEEHYKLLMHFFADKIGTEFVRNRLVETLNSKQKELLISQEISQMGSYNIDYETGHISFTTIAGAIIGVKQVELFKIKDWMAMVHPDDLLQYKEKVIKDVKNKKNIDLEYRIFTKDKGELKWVHCLSQLNYKEGKLVSILGTIQDITQRKMAEEKIIRSDAILQKLDTIVLVVNKEVEVTYLSPSVKDILGYDSEDLLGNKWWELTFTDAVAANKVKENTCGVIDEVTLKYKDTVRKTKTKSGKYKWISWHMSNTVGDSLIYLGTDITEKYGKEIQYKILTETASDAIVISNNKGIIIEWNKAATRIFGYPKEKIIGKELCTIMPEKYRPAHTKGFGNSVKKGVINDNSIRILEGLTKEETVFPIEISFNLWEIDNNRFYCAFIRDISERQHEASIKKIIFDITKYAHSNPKLVTLLSYIRERLSTVIETSNFYVALYNTVKQTFSLPYIVGKDADLQGKSFPLGKSLTAYVLRKKCITLLTHTEFEALAKKGEVKLVGQPSKIWLGVPLIENGETIGLLAVQNFTDREAFTQKDIALLELVAASISQTIKQAQDLEKINLLNTALIQSAASIVITDRAGSIEYVNPTFTKWSGYSSEEAIGQNPRILKSGKQPDAYYKNLWDAITSGKIWKGEFVNKRLDNSNYLVSVSISPVKNATGEITHFIGIQEDITEKRQLERDYIHAFIDAQEEEKEHFGEELHDGISQILAAEAMYIEILIRQNKDRLDDKAKYLYKVRELNLSAIEDARNISHGLMSKQLKEQGLILAVEQICDNFSKSKNIDFKFTCKKLVEDDVSKEIKTNLYRVTQEISTNIIRHAAAKKAFISFEKIAKNRLKLIIKDDGVGIDLDKIKKEKKGAGLKNIERRITLLGGKIDITSQPNKGTCYTIEVPLEDML